MDDRLYRSRDDRMLAGVAGGVAERLDADPSIIRIVWALLVILTGGLALIVYIVMAVVVPDATARSQGGRAGPAGLVRGRRGDRRSGAARPAKRRPLVHRWHRGGWLAPDGSVVPMAAAPTAARPAAAGSGWGPAVSSPACPDPHRRASS